MVPQAETGYDCAIIVVSPWQVGLMGDIVDGRMFVSLGTFVGFVMDHFVVCLLCVFCCNVLFRLSFSSNEKWDEL